MTRPTASAITDDQLDRLYARLEAQSALLGERAQMAAVLLDLDRCQHGRHHGDPCGPADDCTGTSAGNPHVRPGQVIGYDRGGSPLVMPDRDSKYDPANWRGGAR